MRLIRLLLLIISTVFLFLSGCHKTTENTSVAPSKDSVPLFYQPFGFPQPIHPDTVTTAGFELGKALFYDGILSKDSTIFCGFCHIQTSAFTQHSHRVSHGYMCQLGTRNPLPLFNLAWQSSYFWDGGVIDVDLTPLKAITSPIEMAETIPNVLKKLNRHATYPQRFKNVFGKDTIDTAQLLKALSQYLLTIISANSRYDAYLAGNKDILSPDELEGLQLIITKCTPCHQPPLFTDNSFRNNGLTNNFSDEGRYDITLNPADMGKFKVPTLRNLQYTVPYMHTGAFTSLTSVLNHYQSGIVDSPTLDTLLKPGGVPNIPMTDDEKAKIILFLGALNDPSIVSDPRFTDPVYVYIK